MAQLFYFALVAAISLTLTDACFADGNTYGQYMSTLTQQQKDTKPIVNSQFFVTNATNRANVATIKGTSSKHRNVIQGMSDGGANFDSVNIGPNARLNGATIIVRSDHSNSTIVTKHGANQ